MRTLDHWVSRFLTVPRAIECLGMRLTSMRDELVWSGPGRIDLKTLASMNFTMYATPRDERDAFRRYARAQKHPYDASATLFRLEATDYEGVEWNCGWTQPRQKGMPKMGWLLVGELQGMTTVTTGRWVAQQSGVELVYLPSVLLPMGKWMKTVTTIDSEEIESVAQPGEKRLDLLGSTVRFAYPPSHDALWVTATTSSRLPHPHLEQWLSEPLRVLLGQLMYPRLMARNFEDGRAFVTVRPSPPRLRDMALVSLLGKDPLGAGPEFWELYAGLLALVSRNGANAESLEKHRVTSYYEELIQATQGSRWVLCMTLASVAEGLARMLSPSGKLKKVDTFMKQLASRGILLENNQRAWTQVRHAVMHGTLVSPWSTQDEDERILSLADLVHRLTRELVRISEASSS